MTSPEDATGPDTIVLPEAPPPGIVVGVDGSPGAVAALRWALREARLRSLDILAVTASEYPTEFAWNGAPVLGRYDPAADAATMLNGVLADVIAQDAGEPVPVRRQTGEGSAAAVLLRAAHDAELLVVGTRGHGGFVGLLLGSVSQHCVQHAPCPVVVVPGAPRPTDTAAGVGGGAAAGDRFESGAVGSASG